jgi:hypothetical protein
MIEPDLDAIAVMSARAIESIRYAVSHHRARLAELDDDSIIRPCPPPVRFVSLRQPPPPQLDDAPGWRAWWHRG